MIPQSVYQMRKFLRHAKKVLKDMGTSITKVPTRSVIIMAATTTPEPATVKQMRELIFREYELIEKKHVEMSPIYQMDLDQFIITVIMNYLFVCGINKYPVVVPAPPPLDAFAIYAAKVLADNIGCPIEVTDIVNKLKTTRRLPGKRVYACPFCGLIRARMFTHLLNHAMEIAKVLQNTGIIYTAAHFGLVTTLPIRTSGRSTFVDLTDKIDYEDFLIHMIKAMYEVSKR